MNYMMPTLIHLRVANHLEHCPELKIVRLNQFSLWAVGMFLQTVPAGNLIQVDGVCYRIYMEVATSTDPYP